MDKLIMRKKFDNDKFVFVLVDTKIYCIVDEDYFGEDTFKCVDNDANEFIFNYSDVERIEG